MNQSIDFFARQFDRQIATGDYALNLFEELVLPHLRGSVLDLGCGLGNLALAAARRGHPVTAIDACVGAVEDLRRRAHGESLALEVVQHELSHWKATGEYDTVVSIGLLMFLSCEEAEAVLAEMRSATIPGGLLAVNVLVAGTTFMDMFEPGRHCLWAPEDLLARFGGWNIIENLVQEFPAGAAQVKRFSTVIAERPA